MENNLKDQHYKNMGIRLQMDTLAFEAESVAYVVCQHYGINTSDYSFSYVAGWSEGKETPELKSSLDKIRQTAAEFISKIDEKMEMLMATKEQSYIAKMTDASEKITNSELQEVLNVVLKDMDKKRTSVKSKIKENAEKTDKVPRRGKTAKPKEERA